MNGEPASIITRWPKLGYLARYDLLLHAPKMTRKWARYYSTFRWNDLPTATRDALVTITRRTESGS